MKIGVILNGTTFDFELKNFDICIGITSSQLSHINF